MPTYEFQADDGEVIERVRPMARAPRIGSVLRVKGKVYRRVASLGVGSAGIVREYRHVAHSLPRKWQWPTMPHNKFDERGRAVFESKRDVEKFQAAVKDRPGYSGKYRYNEDTD